MERAWPPLVGLAFAAASSPIGAHFKVHIAQDLANPIITILAINTGFLAAALAVLLTAQGLQSVKRMQTVNHFNYLVDYHWQGVITGFIAAILSLCVIIICKALDHVYQLTFFSLWVFSVGWAFTAFLRVVYILKVLLRN